MRSAARTAAGARSDQLHSKRSGHVGVFTCLGKETSNILPYLPSTRNIFECGHNKVKRKVIVI